MISLEKAALRRALLAKRERLSHREAKSREIRRQVLELPQVHRAKALLLYLSMGSEVDTWGIFEQALAAGKEVFAPRCLDKQGHMAFHRVDSREDLVAGAFGLLEPDPARCPLWQGESGALCLVPGLAFDEEGFRLGYGKGYYDRFLTSHPVETVGLCFGDLVVPRLPHSPLDRRVSALVTEAGVLAFPQGSAQERMVAHE